MPSHAISARRPAQPAAPAPGASRPVRQGFPLRVAAIDMGSNAIRFVAAEFISPTQCITLESDRAPVRLGAGAFSEGRLSAGSMEKALQALTRFKERMRILNIEHYRAIATSAVRESSNGAEFANRVRAKLDLDLEIIGGAEETQLVYRAVKARMTLGKKPWLLANLGGGSLEVALVNQGGVLISETHTIGAVRLWEEFKASARRPKQFVQLLEEYAATLRLSLGGIPRPWAGLIATGGNIEELAQMGKAPEDKAGIRTFALTQLRQLLDTLPTFSLRQRMVRWEMNQDRADVVLPAAVVYAHLCQVSGQTSMRIPYAGTKEGILYDLVDRLTQDSTYRLRQEEQLLQLTVSLGRRYQFDEAHARQVCKLSLALFDQLQKWHGLKPEDQRILMVASLLHDIGAYISYKKHHKHSLYLIAQSELPGVGPEDMLMAANVARYHRKNVPQMEHESFARLTRSQRTRVSQLASLLRLADALDRDHAQTVRRLTVQVRRPFLNMVISGKGFRELEHWALERKAQLFTQIFGLRVRIVPERT